MKCVAYISTVLTLIFGELGFCQENLEALDAAPKAGGTQALSMGGVFIATNKGIDALSGNPGGLARLNGVQISVGGSLLLWGKSDFDAAFYKQSWEFKTYSNRFKILPQLKNIGLVFPITIPNTSIKLAGAVGYRTFYDWNRKKIVEGERRDYGGENVVKHKKTYETQGLINVLSLGFGTTISGKWSFGFSVNFPIWKNYENESEIDDIYSDRTYKFKTHEEWDVSADRFIQLGGIFQVTSKLAVGISGLMNHGFVIENGKGKSHYNGEAHSYEIDRKSKWEIPGTVDFGISYRLKPHLLLAADIQSRPWEDVRIDDLPIDNVKNGNAYRFGLEYGRRILFRTGFAWDRLPLLNADDQPVDIKNLTAGIGYKSNHFILDLGASYKFVTFDAERWGKKWDYHIREFVIHTTLRYGGF